MKRKLQHKFEELRDSPDSFRPPVFIIDSNKKVSVINGFGPSRTGGNTLSKAHVLSNLKEKGDFAEFSLNVINNAEFDVYIKQKNTDGVGMLISISVDEQQITHQFSEALIQKVGSISLTDKSTLLALEVLNNNSYKPWAQISSLRRIFLVPKGDEINLETLAIPQ